VTALTAAGPSPRLRAAGRVAGWSQGFGSSGDLRFHPGRSWPAAGWTATSLGTRRRSRRVRSMDCPAWGSSTLLHASWLPYGFAAGSLPASGHRLFKVGAAPVAGVDISIEDIEKYCLTWCDAARRHDGNGRGRCSSATANFDRSPQRPDL